MFPYTSFVLEYRFAPSVHVHNLPLPGSGQGVKNYSILSPTLRLRARRLKSYSCYESRPHAHRQTARAEPSRHTHTHTHTLSLSLSLSPSPAGSRAINNRQSTTRNHTIIYSFPFRTLTRTLRLRFTISNTVFHVTNMNRRDSWRRRQREPI